MFEHAPWIVEIMRWGGVVYLVWFAWTSIRSAFGGPEALTTTASGATAQDKPSAVSVAAATAARLTFLNPHVSPSTQSSCSAPWGTSTSSAGSSPVARCSVRSCGSRRWGGSSSAGPVAAQPAGVAGHRRGDRRGHADDRRRSSPSRNLDHTDRPRRSEVWNRVIDFPQERAQTFLTQFRTLVECESPSNDPRSLAASARLIAEIGEQITAHPPPHPHDRGIPTRPLPGRHRPAARPAAGPSRHGLAARNPRIHPMVRRRRCGQRTRHRRHEGRDPHRAPRTGGRCCATRARSSSMESASSSLRTKSWAPPRRDRSSRSCPATRRRCSSSSPEVPPAR